MDGRSILRDVARSAGVSMRTASRVLNDDPNVAAVTRARVRAVMQELKYTPDAMARSLRAGTDATLGLVVESVADPFFAELVASVERAVVPLGKSVLIASTHGDLERERAVVGEMLRRRVSGLLLTPAAGDHSWLATDTPLVLIDRLADGLSADLVRIDDRAAAALAVGHLIAHGHRRIGYVGDLPEVATSADRLAGYRDALAAHGIVPPAGLVRATCPDAGSAAAATHELLAGPTSGTSPTALFSANPRSSLGVVPALHADRRTDVALVGFGDFAMADALEPAITVIDHSPAAVGVAAAELLAERLARPAERLARPAERLADPEPPHATRYVPVRLVLRGSGELRPGQSAEA